MSRRGPGRHGRNRELRYLPITIIQPEWRTKETFACCRAARDSDPLGRYPVGDCGPDCERKAWRRQQHGGAA